MVGIGRWRFTAVIGLVSAVVTSCSNADQPPNSFPVRPAEIAVDRLDPCSMLDDAQRLRLGLSEGTPKAGVVNDMPTKACTWITGRYGYNAQTIPLSASVARTEAGAISTTVNGFGAVLSLPQGLTGGAPTCQLTIDAAQGQTIRVQAGAVPRPPVPSNDEMCRLAIEAASMVMTTVVRQAG